MRTYLRIDKDATIYERFPTKNTGLDEILEIGKAIDTLDTPVVYTSASAYALVSFNITKIPESLQAPQYFLRLFLANATDVHRYQLLEVYPISSPWIEGSGYFYQEPTNVSDGVVWGGVVYDELQSSSVQISDYPIQDIRINITDLVTAAQATPEAWNGLLIKYPVADEDNSSNRGNIKVFSANTHTIYNPLVEIVDDSQQFFTGSLKPIPGSNISIIPKNLKQSYTRGEIDKVYLVVRDLYPNKRFDAAQRYRNTYYLPQTTYYRLVDQASGVKIHDFDQYSAVNCDASGSYILLDTTGLDINRFYDIQLKVEDNGLVYYPEFTYTFTVDTDG
jgi:hypothetical protein